MIEQNGIHIGGAWRRGAAQDPDVNPSDTRDVVGEYALGSAQDVHDAVAAARAAFPAWSAALSQRRA
jgi:alpha-ketoglutaric semialdehyde dehydrogenase